MTDERRVFAEVVEDRSVTTISRVVSEQLAEGSILHIDCWRAYPVVAEEFGLEHHTVNHSVGFIDYEPGVNTNSVEETNYAIKPAVPPSNRTQTHLMPFLFEFVWRRTNEGKLWQAFVEVLSEIGYDIK